MVLGNINIHVQNPDFLFMVEYAIKAPSGHNTQPWLFRINENNIEIHPNFDRALPVVDFVYQLGMRFGKPLYNRFRKRL